MIHTVGPCLSLRDSGKGKAFVGGVLQELPENSPRQKGLRPWRSQPFSQGNAKSSDGSTDHDQRLFCQNRDDESKKQVWIKVFGPAAAHFATGGRRSSFRRSRHRRPALVYSLNSLSINGDSWYLISNLSHFGVWIIQIPITLIFFS